MGWNSGIGWTDATWSPWFGCSKVSPGCTNCYAEAGSRRNPGVLGVWGPKGTRPVSKSWDTPVGWDRKAAAMGTRYRVFPSLCDVFEDRPDLVDPRSRFLRLVRDTPHLDWQVLTKRPENIARMLARAQWVLGRDDASAFPPESPAVEPNLWIGTSVESQDYADRIWHLTHAWQGVRFVSCEPLIGPVNLRPFLRNLERDGIDCDPGLDWVIVGGESGPNRRPMELAWLESIVSQCKDAGIPVYVKQDAALRDSQQGRIPDSLWAIKEMPAPRIPAGGAA